MNRSAKLAIGSTFMALLLGVGGCTVDKTDEGSLPDVDVQGGDLPNYEINDADVDVGIEEQSVPLPDVDIEPER